MLLLSSLAAAAVLWLQEPSLLCSAASVDDLLASLTLEEKIGQMNQIDIEVFVDESIPGLIPLPADPTGQLFVGHPSHLTGWDTGETVPNLQNSRKK